MNAKYQIGTPIFLPEQASDLPLLLSRVFEALRPDLLQAVMECVANPSPGGLLAFEEKTGRLTQIIGGHIVAGVVSYLHTQETLVDDAVDEARRGSLVPLRHRGWRNTSVRFLGGVCLTVWTPYLSEDRKWRPGPKRGIGRRGAAGGGCYPLLHSLGILGRATPALYSEVSRQVVRNASIAEARQTLAERGIDLDEKTVRAIFMRVGAQALEQRQARIEAAAQGQVFSDELAGKRIVISTDGGRLRLREGGDRGRRNKNGHRRYRTPWIEPKVIVVYVIDAKGDKVRELESVYDATLGDADATFEILTAELLLRGAAKAKEIILTADGAWWIWNRADALAEALHLAPGQLVKVADFYHAVEHLTAIADLCTRWTAATRKAWIRRMSHDLKAGRIDKVLETARALRPGRSKKIATEIKYFENRREFMQYGKFRRRKIPLGSGAVESAVRRVINLRLKGPAIFWRDENAERMLHLRAYYKAGRWNELMLRVMHRSPCGMPAAVHAAMAA